MNSLIAALGFFVVSVLYALSGHLLWRFYAFLWRSLIGLLGFSKKQIEPEPATVPAGAAAAAEATVARVLQQHGQALLGLLGCVLAAWAFFWLLGDLVADQFTQRAIQLAALLLLTAALLFWGFRVRSAAPDTLGTGLLLLGFLQIPVDAWFYERYILGYTTRSAYQVALLLAALATFLAVRLGSRVFSWLAPQCLLAGILLIGYKLHWPASAVSYTAALSGPLLLAVALWLESVPRAKLLLMPMRVAAVAAAVAAEASFLGSSPEAVPWLPLAVALLGGGTIATVAYLASDLRGLLLLLPYFGFAFVEYFERYSTSYGPVGTVAAIAGLALLALERTRRQGAERRRGLDPWCAVPALFCLLLALSVDGLSVALSVSRVANLTPPGQIAVTGFEDAASLWADAERAIFYLARLDGTLAWASASGPLVACGLIYLGGAAAVPLFAYGGGLPLAIGALATLMRALPFELHGQSYAFCLLVMALLGASAGIVLKQPRTLAAARACGLFAHLLLPLAWFALGYRLYQPNTTPEWFLALVFAVIGAQAMFHGRIAASYPFLARLGCGMLAASWPLAIGMMPSWAARSGLVPLVACGLVVNGAIVGWAMARQEVVHALLGAAGLVLTVIVTLTTVLHGEIGAKLAILVFGLLLLYAGTRGRRRAVVGLAALWLALPAAAAPPAVPQRVTTRETLQALARANGEDPLIAVVLRATDVPVPGSETTDRLSSKLREGLSALSGIDSVQAALALASSPLRIRGSAESVASIEIDRVRAVQPRSLPYANLAKRLPGRPQLPDTAGDELDRGPADWVHLRFESAAALGRILDLYEQRGRAILAVTAPGLALPSPEAKFREMAGVELRKAIEGCTGGVLLIGDPYLGLAPELVLAARFADEAAAEARVAAWKAGAAGRTGRTGTVAILGTTSGGTEYVLSVFQGQGRQLGAEPDFRYASLLGLKGPDGRLFVSEEAVKRLVSPGFWIASHRREDCLAELADLEAADAFGRLTQRPLPAEPEGARKKALELGWIEPRGQCRAAGSTVSRSEGGTLECSSHGSRLRPRPLRETPSFWVTAEESEAYSNFSWRYSWLYSTWIDPVEVAIEAGPNRAVLETAILPVARQQAYNTLLAWHSAAERNERRQPIALPRGYEKSLAAVAARVPLGDGDVLWRSRFRPWFGRYYSIEPALWRLRDLESPSPLGSAFGVMLLPGDPAPLANPRELWRSPVPAPIALTRSVVSSDRARRWLGELMGGNGHWSEAAMEGYGFRAAGRLEVHSAIDERSLVVTTSRPGARELMSAPARTGALPGAGAWLRVRPAALWESARAFRGLGAGLLGARCREVLASRQNLHDLGVPAALPAGAWPRGEPFLDPAAACPAGGKYDLEGPLARCSLHGTLDRPADPPPAEDSPLAALLRSLDAIEVEAAALDDGILTRVMLEGK